MDGRVPAVLANFEVESLASLFEAWGYKPSHAARVLRSFYASGGLSVDDGSPWPAGLLSRLEHHFERAATIASRQESADGTVKLLLRLADGRTVESVLMPAYRADRAAGCLSTQVGCAMRCDFCATTKTGFERNLSAAEIIEQFLHLRREALNLSRTLQTVVFMGMGEPLMNLEAVLTAGRRMAEQRLGGVGWRQITVSTVGVIPGLEALRLSGLNLQLAVSLHAPDDTTRARLLPIGQRYPVSEILAAVDRFQNDHRRPVTVQYCLLAGVNDSPAQAELLADLIGSRRLHVNLLRYNSTGTSLQGVHYEPSSEEASEAFAEILRSRGVVAHFRRSRGPDIDAACGQLRRRWAQAESLADQNSKGTLVRPQAGQRERSTPASSV